MKNIIDISLQLTAGMPVWPGSPSFEITEGASLQKDAYSETKLMEQIRQKHPVGRVGHPSEIGEAIFFLADGQRSSFVTGTFLIVGGVALGHLYTE